MDTLAFASEFPAVTADTWRALAEKALKGVDLEKALTSRTADGLRIEPLYPKAESPEPVLRAPARPWRVCARIDHPEPEEARALALADLEGGADALTLAFAGAPAARGFGVRIGDLDALDATLGGAMLDLFELGLESAPFAGREAVRLALDLVARRGQAPGEVTVHLGLDPAGDLARTGSLPLPWPELSARFAGLVAEALGRGLGGTAARIDGRPFHEAGASEAQELGAALSTGVLYLRALEAEGIPLDVARASLLFLLVADADMLMTVAKFRAARRLWARIETACGLEPRPMRLQAETAWRMLTRRDPFTNLLRGTIAAFSAGIGNADSVTVLPFTAALGLPDAFARRLARNTGLILLDESNLWRVADPAAGSGGFEAMTAELEEAAWAEFVRIEGEGGIAASLGAGALAGRIAGMRERAERAVATRRAGIIGTSEFPHLGEAPVEVLLPPREAGSPEARGGALPSVRLAEAYERLRDRSDAILAETGSRPRVFLAQLGPVSAFTARSTFARNAFEAAGIEAVAPEGADGLDPLVEAYRFSGARIACLCSSDAVYAEKAEPTARALRDAGCETVLLAGRPGEREEALREAGVARFLFAGSDLPALLGDLLK